jgi:hypothetical protein
VHTAQAEPRRRAKPGAVIAHDELPPTQKQTFEAGYITKQQYIQMRALEDHVKTLPRAVWKRGVTLPQVKRDPRFQSRVAHYAGITRIEQPANVAPTARPAGAARERRDSGSTSSRGGDSGDSSDDPEPAGPGDPVGDTSRVDAPRPELALVARREWRDWARRRARELARLRDPMRGCFA